MPDTRITIRLSDEDDAWIKAQSDALGLDNAAAVVRMLIRQARLGNVSLNVVMLGMTQPIRQLSPYEITPDQYRIPADGRLVAIRGATAQASVGEAYAEDIAPVPEAVVEDLLASRLEELAASPAIPSGIAPLTNGHAAAPIAVSLRPAPPRMARDYR